MSAAQAILAKLEKRGVTTITVGDIDWVRTEWHMKGRRPSYYGQWRTFHRMGLYAPEHIIQRITVPSLKGKRGFW